MAIEVHHEIIDKFIKTNDDYKSIISEACTFMGKKYSVTNYAVTCDNKIVCFTGSDICDAVNLCSFLEKKFPGKHFSYSEEFPSID